MLSPLTGTLTPLGVNRHITQTFDDYAISLGLALYYKCNEASGNVLNYGTIGSACDATVTGAVGQVIRQDSGQLGAGHAISLTGVGTQIETPWNSVWANATTYGIFILVRYNSNRPQSDERLFGRNVGPGGGRNDVGPYLEHFVRNSAITTFRAQSLTAFPTNGVHQLIFFEYDDSSGRVPRLYVNGTEATYSLQQTLTGTLQTFSSPNTFTWFNNHALNVGADVTVSAFGFLAGSTFTPTQKQTLTTLAGL